MVMVVESELTITAIVKASNWAGCSLAIACTVEANDEDPKHHEPKHLTAGTSWRRSNRIMAWSRGHGAAISDSDGKDDDNDDDDGSTKGRGGGAVGELAKYAVPRLCACEERKRRRGKAMAASEVVKIARTTRDSAWHLFRRHPISPFLLRRGATHSFSSSSSSSVSVSRTRTIFLLLLLLLCDDPSFVRRIL